MKSTTRPVYRYRRGQSKVQVAEYGKKAIPPVNDYKPSVTYQKAKRRLVVSACIKNRERIKDRNAFRWFYTIDVAIPNLVFNLISYMKYEFPKRSERFWAGTDPELRALLVLKG